MSLSFLLGTSLVAGNRLASPLPTAQDELNCIQALQKIRNHFIESALSREDQETLYAEFASIRAQIQEATAGTPLFILDWGDEWVTQLKKIDPGFIDYWEKHKSVYDRSNFVVRRNILLRYLRYRMHRSEFINELYDQVPGMFQVVGLRDRILSDYELRSFSLFPSYVTPHLQEAVPHTRQLYFDTSIRNAPRNLFNQSFVDNLDSSEDVERVSLLRGPLFDALGFTQDTPISMLGNAAIERGLAHQSEWRAWQHFTLPLKYKNILSISELQSLQRMAHFFARMKVGGEPVNGIPTTDAWILAEALFNSDGVLVTRDKGMFNPFKLLLEHTNDIRIEEEQTGIILTPIKLPSIKLPLPFSARIDQIEIRYQDPTSHKIFRVTVAILKVDRAP